MALSPTSQWVLDYAPEYCRLVRRFGEGEQTVLLRIDSFGARHFYTATAIGGPLRTGNGPSGTVDYRLSPDPQMREDIHALFGTSANQRSVSFGISFGPPEHAEAIADADFPEQAALSSTLIPQLAPYYQQVHWIDLRMRGHTVRLELGSMAPPLEALESCVDDLHTHWGFDAAQARELQRGPSPRLQTLRRAPYPMSMAMRGISAAVPVRMVVDAQGVPSNCVVQVEDVEEAFRQAVCASLDHEFEPALDREGNPVRAMFHTKVVYLMN